MAAISAPLGLWNNRYRERRDAPAPPMLADDIYTRAVTIAAQALDELERLERRHALLRAEHEALLEQYAKLTAALTYSPTGVQPGTCACGRIFTRRAVSAVWCPDCKARMARDRTARYQARKRGQSGSSR